MDKKVVVEQAEINAIMTTVRRIGQGFTDYVKSVNETLDRCRRIETRLTSYLASQGETIGNRKPRWDGEHGMVIAPHLDCSISSCMGVVPFSRQGELIDVVLDDGQWLASVIGRNSK